MKIHLQWMRKLQIHLICIVLGFGACFSVVAFPGEEARLYAHRVANHPDSGWGFNFPAISETQKKIAVIDTASSDVGDISLTFLCAQDQRPERAFPLPQKQGGQLSECAESELCMEDRVFEPNGYLEAGGFVTMWPIFGSGSRELPLPEEVISFYHFRILYNKSDHTLTIAHAIGRGPDGALAGVEYQSGKVCLHERLPIKEVSRSESDSELCSGTPFPYAGWVNPDWRDNGTRVILLRIGYDSSEECELPDEWLSRVIEP